MKRKAFTLIELLIVVAIIGILAAIAVPNFLNAQLRAKIARGYSDMKAILTAVEQCRLDRNATPVDGWDDDTTEGRKILKEVFNGVSDWPEAQRYVSHYLYVLTSPISYLSAVPMDPFMVKMREASQRGVGSPLDTYWYCDVDPMIPGRDQGCQALNSAADGGLAERYGLRPLNDNEYALVGVGPDGVMGIGNNPTGANPDRGFPYDASNGIISWGDIIMRSGGGIN